MTPAAALLPHVTCCYTWRPLMILPRVRVFLMCRLAPAFAELIMQTPTLYLEDNSEQGSTLAAAFQLSDAVHRTTVGMDGLQVRARLGKVAVAHSFKMQEARH